MKIADSVQRRNYDFIAFGIVGKTLIYFCLDRKKPSNLQLNVIG